MQIYKTAVIIILTVAAVFGQTAPWHQKTLLEDDLLNWFIDEVSGETAMQHVIEMAAYNRNRRPAEYRDTYLEAVYVLKTCQAYGFDTYEIEYFDADSMWDGEIAELWEISPGRRKLADYDDMTAMLARGSEDTDLTAELVYVGRGTSDKDYEGLDVRGKIVLGESSVGTLHNVAVGQKGAAGVISCNSARSLDDPDQLPWSGIRSRTGKNTFGFNLGTRRGYALRDRLLRGEKITVRAVVDVSMQPNRDNVVSASITGSQYPDESVIFSAHLFEGIVKQGANDNISGSAVLLEVGRTMLELIKNGVIDRPKRTLRFLWVPEFSGTIPWVDEHKSLIEKTLVNINLDMVGLHLAKSGSRFNLERTPFSRPTYLNDVVESVMEYVGQTNWETLHSRAFPNPITAPTGSHDPFQFYIDTHYGASDHVVFNDWGVGVPGIMLITWPDLWYHSSEDRPDKLDPTQLKRAAFISAVSGYVIADAGNEMILRLCGEIFSNGTRRMGGEYQRAVEMLNFTAADALPEAYKRALNILQVTAGQEAATLGSLMELKPGEENTAYILQLQKTIARSGELMEKQLQQYYRLLCDQKRISARFPSASAEEKRAAAVVPRPTQKVSGYFQNSWMEGVDRDAIRSMTIGYNKIRELRALIDGRRSVLEMARILDAEYETPTRIEDVMNYLNLLKKAGLVEY